MNYFCVKEHKEINGQWEDFQRSCSNSTFFHQKIWHKALENGIKQRIVVITINSFNNEIVGGLFLLKKQKFGIRIGQRPWATPYNGLILKDNLVYSDKLKIIRNLIDYLEKNYHYVDIAMPIGYKDIYLFQKYNWDISVKNTYLLCKSKDELLNTLEANVKRQVKKAVKLGIVYKESDDMGPLYRMYCELFKRQSISVSYSLDDFKSLYQVLSKTYLVKLYYTFYDNVPIAGMLIASDKKIHYYVISASEKKHLNLGAPSFLLYNYINNLKEGEIFDFVGAIPKLETLTKFKSKFNPSEQPYFVIEKRGVVKILLNLKKKFRI
jgi:lipid II:glycine glycyltransferase (peptidoglycan interpeptide bridge formation enzyme)